MNNKEFIEELKTIRRSIDDLIERAKADDNKIVAKVKYESPSKPITKDNIENVAANNGYSSYDDSSKFPNVW